MKRPVLTIICSICLAGSALAQSSAQAAPNVSKASKTDRSVISLLRSGTPGINEFSFWGGYSFQSNDGIWGNTPSAQLSLMGMRYNRKFLSFPSHKVLEYTFELNLIAKYYYPEFTLEAARTSLSGFGVSPVGLQFNWREDQPVQPFLKSAAGFIYLDNPFPDQRGTKLNFTLEFGGGLEFQINNHLSFTFGYKYHHMSNGQFGIVNPGIDSNLFYGAFTIF